MLTLYLGYRRSRRHASVVQAPRGLDQSLNSAYVDLYCERDGFRLQQGRRKVEDLVFLEEIMPIGSHKCQLKA